MYNQSKQINLNVINYFVTQTINFISAIMLQIRVNFVGKENFIYTSFVISIRWCIKNFSKLMKNYIDVVFKLRLVPMLI